MELHLRDACLCLETVDGDILDMWIRGLLPQSAKV